MLSDRQSHLWSAQQRADDVPTQLPRIVQSCSRHGLVAARFTTSQGHTTSKNIFYLHSFTHRERF